MSSFVTTIEKPRLSLKAQTLATLAAVVGAVVVPQFFHALGAISGLGTSLGELFLPMHLPIILVGLLAGPCVGAIAGFFGPLASFALSGMPGIVMLPFMMIELCAYGFFAGLLRSVKIPTIGKVIAVQIGGRVVRAAAIAFAVYILGNKNIQISVIWTSLKSGVFGLCLQWTLLPLLIYRIEHMNKEEIR